MMLKIFKGYWNETQLREKAKQASLLFFSSIISMGLAFVTSIYVTRYLPPSEYGVLKFILIIWSFLSLLITFGFFHSAGQALLNESCSDGIREIIGADLMIAFIMGLIIYFISFVLAKPIEIIFDIETAVVLRVVAPLIIFIPMKDSLTLIFQCTNKILLLFFFNIVPPSLYLLFIVILPQIQQPNIINITYGQQFSMIVVIVAMIFVMKPSFHNLKQSIKKILAHQKTYGTPVFIALLCSVATQQINRIGVVYWVDNASIGFYSLASNLVQPMSLIPSSVATSSFRNFSKQKSISKKVIIATLLATLLTLIITIFILGRPLNILYPADYATNVSQIGRWLSIGVLFQGFGLLLNRFLGANGQGNALRNSAIFVGIINVLGFIFFTPTFGLSGMVASVILGDIVFFIFMLAKYRDFTHKGDMDNNI